MSAEHSRSAESAGVLKIDCLPNGPAPGPLQTCTGRTEVRAPNCVSRIEEQRCCTENTALGSRRTVKDFAATCRLPVTATTDFVARDILNRCGRAYPGHRREIDQQVQQLRESQRANGASTGTTHRWSTTMQRLLQRWPQSGRRSSPHFGPQSTNCSRSSARM